MKNTKIIRLVLMFSTIFTFAIGIGVWVGASFVRQQQKPENVVLQNTVEKFHHVLRHVDQDYVDDEIDLPAITESAIVNMLEALDPYTTYITAKELAIMNQSFLGS